MPAHRRLQDLFIGVLRATCTQTCTALLRSVLLMVLQLSIEQVCRGEIFLAYNSYVELLLH